MKTLAIVLLVPFAVTLAPILLAVAAVVGLAYAGRKWLPALLVALLWAVCLFVAGFTLYFALVGVIFAADYTAGMIGQMISYGYSYSYSQIDAESIFITLMFAAAVTLPTLPKVKTPSFPRLGKVETELPTEYANIDFAKLAPIDTTDDNLFVELDAMPDTMPAYVTEKFNVLCPDGVIRVCKMGKDRKTGKVKAFGKTVSGALCITNDGRVYWNPTGKNAAVFNYDNYKSAA